LDISHDGRGWFEPATLSRGKREHLSARTTAEPATCFFGRSAIVDDSMDRLTVYEKPTCSTCRSLASLLEERGVDFETVDYHVEGLSEGRLRGLLAKAGVPARDILRMKEPLVAELGLADRAVEEDELIAAMVEHPELVQRPLVERGGRAVLARPVERVLELLEP
jgi:arsenate reductase